MTALLPGHGKQCLQIHINSLCNYFVSHIGVIIKHIKSPYNTTCAFPSHFFKKSMYQIYMELHDG